MASRADQKRQLHEQRVQRQAEADRAARGRALRLRVMGALFVGLVVLGALYALSNGGRGSSSPRQAAVSGKHPYQIGAPGPGRAAPPVRLASTAGGRFDLAALRGQTVLLYFQEGLTCQPCWDQLKDLERQDARVRALGVDRIVTITTDPLGDLRQKAADEGLHSAVLSDRDLAVSKAYSANRYGMMGDSRDGHSFVVVGPDGRIRWRADYGGAPKYTMYVPVADLLADMRKGLRGAAA